LLPLLALLALLLAFLFRLRPEFVVRYTFSV